MSNIKKIIGVVLALVMALSVVTVAFAAEGDKYSVSISADKTTLTAGESATVTVKVTSNYNVSTMSIPVFFDKAKVTVSEASTTLAGDLKDVKVVTEGDIAKFYRGSGYTEADHGVVALTYVAKEGASIETYNNTTVMTFKVTALANVTGNAVIDCVQGTVKTSANKTGTLYVGKNSSGNDIVDSLAEWIDDADVTAATATINIGGATAEPVLSSINGGVIGDNTTSIDMTGYVYGIPVGTTDFTEYFSVENGTFTVTGTGTGATLQVYDSTGKEAGDPYTVIIFGDVDGSNSITSDDYLAVKAATMTTPLQGAFEIAADVDCSGAVTSDDYLAVKAATMTTPLSQNPLK